MFYSLEKANYPANISQSITSGKEIVNFIEQVLPNVTIGIYSLLNLLAQTKERLNFI